MSAIFNNILSPEEKKNQIEENKIQSNSNKIEEKIIEKEEEEEDKKKDVLKRRIYKTIDEKFLFTKSNESNNF